MHPHFWPKNPKANFLQNRANVSYANPKSYGIDLDFWPKNPKAKTKPIKPNLRNGKK